MIEMDEWVQRGRFVKTMLDALLVRAQQHQARPLYFELSFMDARCILDADIPGWRRYGWPAATVADRQWRNVEVRLTSLSDDPICIARSEGHPATLYRLRLK